MKFDTTRRNVLRGVGAAGVAGVIGAQSAGAQERDPLDRHIVGVEPGRVDEARERAEEVYRVLDFGAIGQAVAGWYSEEALDNLQRNPNVRYIEAEGVMEATDHAADDGDPNSEQVLPWGIDRIDANVAHHDGETGSGSSVAIIDTGIDPTHETLNVTGGEAFVDCRPGWCAADWDDDHDHGTHCAGTADAVNNDVGVVGVSTAADLHAVKVLDDTGSGTFSDVADGIRWTADEDIDVGSLSLGGGHSETVQDACEYAYGEGTLLVAAAGNDGCCVTVNYPAAYEECIAVSAIDENDELAGFSSTGEEVELAAPGVDVLSSIPGDDYERWNGTSMACPHVSGAGAQLMANGYSNTEARDRLNQTAENIGLSDTEQGNGFLDVAAALDVEEGGDDGGENEPVIDTFVVNTRTTGPWARADVEWVVSDEDGDLDEVISELLDNSGTDLNAETSDVSGGSASGEHHLRTRDEPDEVRLTVTDEPGNETSETRAY